MPPKDNGLFEAHSRTFPFGSAADDDGTRDSGTNADQTLCPGAASPCCETLAGIDSGVVQAASASREPASARPRDLEEGLV